MGCITSTPTGTPLTDAAITEDLGRTSPPRVSHPCTHRRPLRRARSVSASPHPGGPPRPKTARALLQLQEGNPLAGPATVPRRLAQRPGSGTASDVSDSQSRYVTMKVDVRPAPRALPLQLLPADWNAPLSASHSPDASPPVVTPWSSLPPPPQVS